MVTTQITYLLKQSACWKFSYKYILKKIYNVNIFLTILQLIFWSIKIDKYKEKILIEAYSFKSFFLLLCLEECYPDYKSNILFSDGAVQNQILKSYARLVWLLRKLSVKGFLAQC